MNARRTTSTLASPSSPDAQQPAPGADTEPRSRLLHAGLRLFATQGYSKTSTRELAEAAQVNVAAISYYFGDKAGLYRAVFSEPIGSPEEDLGRWNRPEQTLREALHGFYAGFLEPLRQGDVARLCTKLHFREMLEPTGLWQADPTFGIGEMHRALLGLLARHLGLPGPDEDLQRLAICLAGLGVHLHVGHDINEVLAPGLVDGSAALDRWAERLVDFGLALIDAERQRRGLPLPTQREP
ncbi:CerR family C-terminal domain-containing protein [Rubrivivax rivuli]|uniref:TetR/AcrR family transcriptional regulator n=1 Tax=Rubrivivax rivuli TaxID=1862385 RepID=A0A437RLP0_9BURK|nr:CerR family C-terminal domain-containing protein [Rubrivivax rivuli]RVU47726.1 TetR/AcrR family transcriptional regulator [Rubrivivax rivuli]